VIGAEMCGKELESADPDVAAGDARENRARMPLFPLDTVAGRDRSERTRGRDVHRRHRFGYEIFAQDGSDRGLAVAAPREGRRPRSLELDVEAFAVGRDDLTEEQRAAVAELRRKMPELMPGVGKRKGIGPTGHLLAREQAGELFVARVGNVDAEPRRECMVEDQQGRRRGLRRFGGGVKALHAVVETIVEGEIHGALFRALAS
jgi:hypothetical protein